MPNIDQDHCEKASHAFSLWMRPTEDEAYTADIAYNINNHIIIIAPPSL